MCISSNWVNDAQDSIAVKKFRDFPNSLIPTKHSAMQCYDLLPVQQQKNPQFVPIGSGAVAAGRQQQTLYSEISFHILIQF